MEVQQVSSTLPPEADDRFVQLCFGLPRNIQNRPWDDGVLECPELQRELKQVFHELFTFKTLQEKIGAGL
eukprot:666011-Pyramimonas_sp.AAC.1